MNEVEYEALLRGFSTMRTESDNRELGFLCNMRVLGLAGDVFRMQIQERGRMVFIVLMREMQVPGLYRAMGTALEAVQLYFGGEVRRYYARNVAGWLESRGCNVELMHG